jgi:hypothetical protein
MKKWPAGGVDVGVVVEAIVDAIERPQLTPFRSVSSSA